MSDPSSDQPPLPPDDYLRAVYARAEYVCNDFVLRVGRRHPDFDRWLGEQGYDHYAFLTAYNPGSVQLSLAVNKLRHQQLQQLLRPLGLPFAPALGRDPAGDWPPEPGVLLFDVGAAKVHELGRLFEQNAVVEGKRNGIPLLVWLRE